MQICSLNKKNDVRWPVLLCINYPPTLFLKFGGFFMPFFRAVIYLLIQSKINSYIAYWRMEGSQPVKKASIYATLPLTMKVEVQSPYNRIIISYNRKGHRAFAVFLLSFFIGLRRRAVSGMRCRSPPLHLNFYIFKNSDWRKTR